MKSPGKPLPPKLERTMGRYREPWLPPPEAPVHKPAQEPAVGKGNWNELFEAQWGQLWELTTPGNSVMGLPWSCDLLWVLSPRAPPHPHSDYQRKIPRCFRRWEEGRDIWKYMRAFCSSSQGLPSGENVQPEPDLLGLHKSLPDPGVGKCPTPAPSRLPCGKREIPNSRPP